MSDFLLDFQTFLNSSFASGLRDVYENHWPAFCDLKIKCGDGETVSMPKLILAIHSEYFAALLRHEPDTSVISLLQFDSVTVNSVIKSLVHFDEKDLTNLELDQVIHVADYLQIKDLVSLYSNAIIAKISKENLPHVFQLTEMIHSPKLDDGCANFIKANIQDLFESKELLLQKLPKSMLLKIFSHPCIQFHDEFGRQCDILETTENLLHILVRLLSSSNRLKDLIEIVKHCFQEEYLYFIVTKDYEKSFSPIFRQRSENVRKQIANVHKHILPQSLDLEETIKVGNMETPMETDMDLKKLILSNCPLPKHLQSEPKGMFYI